MNFIPTREFFKYYQVNFFKFQQIINKEALDNIDFWIEKFRDDSKSNDKEAVIQSLKLSVRLTYLHCIDTLFELFFGLYPRNHIIDDQQLPVIVSKSNDNFNKPRIKGLAEKNEAVMKELDQEISFGKHSISLLQYIIFSQITSENIVASDIFHNVHDSLDPLKKLLIIFANDLNDKSEYNSLKHAFRVVPFTGFFRVLDPKTNKEIAGIDFNNATNFIQKTNDSLRIVTQNFDAERDYKYTLIASKMIWDIIKIRDCFLESKDNPGYHNIFVYFFHPDEFEQFEKSLKHKQKIVFNIKKNVP